MAEAQIRWSQDLGIERPAFSASELQQMGLNAQSNFTGRRRHSIRSRLSSIGDGSLGDADQADPDDTNRFSIQIIRYRPMALSDGSLLESPEPAPSGRTDTSRQMHVQASSILHDQAMILLSSQFLGPALFAITHGQRLWTSDLALRPALALAEQRWLDTLPPRVPSSFPPDLGGLPRERLGSDSTCPICLDTMPAGTREPVGPCHHQFHETCIGQWLVRQNACPLCRERWI
jgi:hypothetical protein